MKLHQPMVFATVAYDNPCYVCVEHLIPQDKESHKITFPHKMTLFQKLASYWSHSTVVKPIGLANQALNTGVQIMHKKNSLKFSKFKKTLTN